MLLNFPYFLYKSLAKMSKKVHKNTKNSFTNLHHSGLIKLLLFHELQRNNNSWEGFLSWNQFGVQITHTTVIPRPVSPHKEDVGKDLSDEDDLPLREVIALQRKRREQQEKEAATSVRVEVEKLKDKGGPSKPK